MKLVTRVEFWVHRLGSHYIADRVSESWQFFVREWGDSQWVPMPSTPELLQHLEAELSAAVV